MPTSNTNEFTISTFFPLKSELAYISCFLALMQYVALSKIKLI